MTGTITVTAHDALRFVPSVVVAVIVALPTAFAVTLPFWSTVATLVLLDDQLRVLFVALVGCTVAVSVSELPLLIVADVWLSVMELTGTLTVTRQDALTPEPSVAVAVMVALPATFAVTLPFWSTVATLMSLDDQLSTE